MSDKVRLFDIIRHQQKNYPNDDCLCHKVDGKWKKYSTSHIIDIANKVSCGLLEIGVQPGDKIALISTMNRPEWNIMDLGILQIGAVDVPMYPTITADDYEYIFNDAEVKYCFVSDKDLYLKAKEAQAKSPSVKEIFTFEDVSGAHSWNEVIKSDITDCMAKLNELMATVKNEDLATLIYTSGTTGRPKGVMLSHNNLVSNVFACIPRLPVDNNAVALSFLPICHVYERMLVYLYMQVGVSVYFAESMDTIADNIREVRPHVFTAVPRLLEKVYDKIIAGGNASGGLKKMIFNWAIGKTSKYVYGQKPNFLAEKLVYSKIRAKLGNRIQAVASGSAALSPKLAQFYNAVGIPTLEGYGLTETSPVISVNADSSGVMFGSVGKVIDGVTVSFASDGEILCKGPNVMMGYYNKPDITKEVIDQDGWFHTGDIGKFVGDGFLKITDRKKEMFKTSGGKYIAPQLMENKYKESGFIEQIMVIGEGKKHPAALLVPAFEFIEQWCKKHDIVYSTPEEMIKNEQLIKRIDAEIDKINTNFGHWEQIKKFHMIPHMFTVEGGELTPTLKFKRKFILNKYQDLVDSIYE